MTVVYLLLAFVVGWFGRSLRQRQLEHRRFRRYVRREVDRVFDQGLHKLAREGSWWAQAMLREQQKRQ